MLLLLLACADSPAPPTDTGEAWSHPLDDVLRLTDVQVKGTHNSYHLAPEHGAVEEWDYSMATLDVQAAEQGVRQFELDVHADDGELLVYHAIAVDEGTTCVTLAECLDTLAGWSSSNPGHLPLLVLLELKDEAGGDPITDYDALEEIVREHGPDAFTPAELRGELATLREAVLDGGWPTLGVLRGRAIYAILDRATHRDAYRARGEGLLFVTPDPEDDDAAVLLMDDPADPGLPGAVEQGFLVRTRADNGEQARAGDTTMRDAALASGAHFVSTDFPAVVEGLNYVVEIPGGTPARCNPVTAPAECEGEVVFE